MSRTAVVTGVAGGVGSWVADRLATEGWSVVGTDLERPEASVEDIEFVAADLTEQGPTWELVQSADPDAVVHCAALPGVGHRPGTETFLNNVTSTYNVLVAAGTADARVVWTSSESAYGMVFADEPWLPSAFPLSEAEPLCPEDPYGTSKVVGEEIGKMVARQYDVPVASLRPSAVQYPGEYGITDARSAWSRENPWPHPNFWSYVDVRDLVGAVEAALDADLAGHEAFNVAAAENFQGLPTAELIELSFGDLPADCALPGEETAYDLSKANELLDWAPEHSYREAERADVAGPDWR
jgi:nucleoside-diphosphate-sugar epimerase